MPRTLSAISHLSPRPADSTAAKVPSQPLKDDKTFASFLGVEKPGKTGAVAKKARSGAASSQAKTNDDVAGFSQSGRDKLASSQADTSLASNAAIASQTQFIPAVSLASYIPISGTEEGDSATQSFPSADASVALQGQRPSLKPTPATKEPRTSTRASAPAAQDPQTINGAVQSYEISGDIQAATSAIERAPQYPKPNLAPELAGAPDTTVRTSEALSSPNLPPPAAAAPQSDKIPSNVDSDGLISVSDASGVTARIAMPPSSADPVKAPGDSVVVRSQTHLVPEFAKAGDGIAGQIATASSMQDQAAALLSPKQLDSELSASTASPRNDVAAKIEAPALAPNQTDPSQTVAFEPSVTKAAAEQRSNMTTDGSSSADTQAENTAASRLTVTPNAHDGGNSHGGSAKDKDSHDYPGDGPAPASDEARRSSEVSLATPFGASGASPSTPTQQILDGIQRAIPVADSSEALTSASQPALDGQQPVKTITVALSPASLGTVAVELSLKSGQLGVKLRVQEAGTAQLLRQDGSLEKLLESAGYAVQSLSIHLSPPPGQAPEAQGQATPNGQSFSNQFSSSGSGREQGHSQSDEGQPTDRNGDQRPGHGRTENVSGGGSLYV